MFGGFLLIFTKLFVNVVLEIIFYGLEGGEIFEQVNKCVQM